MTAAGHVIKSHISIIRGTIIAERLVIGYKKQLACFVCHKSNIVAIVFESDLEDISRHFRRSVPENNATEYAIPFRAVPWNNGNLAYTRLVSRRPTLKRGSGETVHVQKVWRCRNVGSSNQIAPFQIDYVMCTFQKIRGD